MRKKSHNFVRALVILAMVVSIVGVVAAPAAAQVAGLAPTAGPVGTSVTVTATGYAPNSILTATFDSAAVTTAPVVVETDATGAATFALLIPAATAGAHDVKISDGVNTVTQSFTVQPKIKITPTKGPVGTSATVTGSGFAAGVTADVTVGGTAFDFSQAGMAARKSFKRSVAVDVDGSFTAESTIPIVPSGAQMVSAIDGAGNNADGNTGSFTVTPTLALSPTSGLAGSKVDITGSGWLAGAIVNFTFGGGAWVAAQTTVLGDGTIDAQDIATLAQAVPGVKAVSGNDGTNTATVNFTVEPRILNLTPPSGPMGTKVLITGGSMSSDKEILAGMVMIASNPWSTAAITIDTGGVIAPTTLTVPPGLIAGENIVVAIDEMGLVAGNIWIVTKPTVGVSPASGPKGSAVTVQGAGWVPNSTVTLDFAGALMTVIADSNGNIAAAMSVPATAGTGANALTADDGLGNSAEDATFTVPSASITVSPNEGGPGDAVTISGTGFAGYAAIKVKFGDYELPTTPLSSPLGDFSIATTVPGVAPGSQVVQAMDSASTATAFFIVAKAAVTIANQLAGVVDTVVIVWDYNGGDWQFFDPADAAGSNLETLVAGTGYWFNASEAVELIFGGNAYQLTEGWNNVGWRGV